MPVRGGASRSCEDGLLRVLVGDALVEQGRYQEGISDLKRHLKSYPDNIVAHGFLLVAYSELGDEQEARTEAAEVMRINPQFTLASIEKAAHSFSGRT